MDFLPKVEEKLIEDEPDEIEEEIIEEAKPKITEDDIFNAKPKLVIKEVIEPQIVKEFKEFKEEELKTPKPTKKKRVLSEDHKEKLAQARVKALETRRENAKIKREKAQLEKAIKEKELEELRAKAGIRKPKTEVIQPKKEVKEEVKEEIPNLAVRPDWLDKKQYYTQEDIEKASLNAIMGYEKIRKERKAKKREEEEKTKHERELKQQLTQRIMPQNNTNIMYGQQNYWDNCY